MSAVVATTFSLVLPNTSFWSWLALNLQLQRKEWLSIASFPFFAVIVSLLTREFGNVYIRCGL